jgi:hypothetical protein
MARKTKTRVDPGTCTLVWFARLEDALRDGDRGRELEARERLAGLGISRIDFDVAVFGDRYREEVERGRR